MCRSKMRTSHQPRMTSPWSSGSALHPMRVSPIRATTASLWLSRDPAPASQPDMREDRCTRRFEPLTGRSRSTWRDCRGNGSGSFTHTLALTVFRSRRPPTFGSMCRSRLMRLAATSFCATVTMGKGMKRRRRWLLGWPREGSTGVSGGQLRRPIRQQLRHTLSLSAFGFGMPLEPRPRFRLTATTHCLATPQV
uniref:Uncharacterized protein n=1 Tax=uncultured marine virus TaxID=186617 RepID=A0A0F7KZY9_9VIRU|nr:hypothetical protein [uncultured marine virus]